MLSQRCKDPQQRNNGTCYSEGIKVDCKVIELLYSMSDLVGYNDKEEFIDISLDERLEKSLLWKQQWVNRMKQNIMKSTRRAKTDTKEETNPGEAEAADRLNNLGEVEAAATSHGSTLPLTYKEEVCKGWQLYPRNLSCTRRKLKLH